MGCVSLFDYVDCFVIMVLFNVELVILFGCLVQLNVFLVDVFGFWLILLGEEVYVMLFMLVDWVECMLDLQYFIIVSDNSVCELMCYVWVVVDCGVCVCMFVDDLYSDGCDFVFLKFLLYKNIDVWLFNLFLGGWMLNVIWYLSGVVEFCCVNWCMYNKVFIVDNVLVVMGGCNFGVEYFMQNQIINFVDLDVLVVGLVVCQLLLVFDVYWNSEFFYLVQVLVFELSKVYLFELKEGNYLLLVMMFNCLEGLLQYIDVLIWLIDMGFGFVMLVFDQMILQFE